MNKAIIMGRITNDIELRQTQSGTAIARFTVAVKRTTRNSDATDFIDCVAWKETAEFMNRHFQKGKPIIVEGSIRADNFENQKGEKRRKVYINVDRAYFSIPDKTFNPDYENANPSDFTDLEPEADLPF